MFSFQKGFLCLTQDRSHIKLSDTAKKEKTPFYLYDLDGMRDRYRLFSKTVKGEVFYAMKANNNLQVLKTFQKEGAGVDVVSGGEISRAEEAGFPPGKMIFSGVGKTKEEISTALQRKILQINVESLEELKATASIARNLKVKAPVALRINPNVDFKSHPYIKTGLTEHKFGIDVRQIPEILDFIKQRREDIGLQGLSQHIGSQIFDLKPVVESAERLKSLYETLRREGFPLKTLDIGGGLGVDYNSFGLEKDRLLLISFGSAMEKLFQNFSGRVFTEPGRFLTARFGLLCAEVLYVKKTPYKNFAVINSGMHHFLRPALYQAVHQIHPFRERDKKETYDVVGTVCETGDFFGKNVTLPVLKAGDLLAVGDTGAYGHVMSNNYNLQTPVREIPFSRGQKVS